MLHTMYLVPAEDYHPSPPPAKRVSKRPLPRSLRRALPRRRSTKQHPHNELMKLCTKHREAELRRNARTKEIADYMKQIMPTATIPPSPPLTYSCLNARQNQDVELRLMRRQRLLQQTHTYGRLKRLYTRRRNVKMSERIMMMMMIIIMTMSFSGRTQRGLVENK